jgi:DNA repair exonuclease SbcCD ATPase subunit
MGHEDVEVPLPDSGVVVVTGDNGSGKSTLVEAVSVALWGKTMRGADWHGDEGDPSVEVELSDVRVSRARRGGKSVVEWGPLDGEAVRHSTATKAQAELAARVGPMESWRRTSVFSSQDVMSFSIATDAERKRLVEEMLCLGPLDGAHAQCRKDLSSERKRLDALSHEVEKRAIRHQGAQRRLDQALEEVGPEPPSVPDEKVSEIADEHEAKSKENGAAVSRSGELRAEARTIVGEIARLNRELGEARKDVCSECGRPLPEGDRAKKIESLEGDVARAEDALRGIADERDTLAARIAAFSRSANELARLLQETKETKREHARWAERARSRAGLVKAVEEELRVEGAAMLDAEDEMDEVREAVAELEVAERVLGLRGVRVAVLGRTLSGLEAVANAWLSRLMPGARLVITSDARLKGGGSSGKIGLEVRGLGHGGDYRACSGGERRRVDVSLLLALAEVQAGARGAGLPTLFLDEVLDTLDQDGVAAVVGALDELSRRRCVVVITHSQDLAEEIGAAMRVAFVGGEAFVL